MHSLMHTGILKIKVNPESVENCEITKCSAFEFGKVHC